MITTQQGRIPFLAKINSSVVVPFKVDAVVWSPTYDINYIFVLERFCKRGMCDICLLTGCLFVNEYFTNMATSMANAQKPLLQSLRQLRGWNRSSDSYRNWNAETLLRKLSFLAS